MNSGRIEQVGAPTEVYESPSSIFIARFLGEANLIEGTIEDVRDGVATLRTSNGLQLRARAGSGVQRGKAAHLFVRPERVSVEADHARPGGDATTNYAAGHLKRTSFLGNILRHSVEICPGMSVVVDVQNSGGSRPPDPGGTTVVSWPVADSLALAS
jgi:putative spermidine/putrescine transport system ATP-binding protein